MTWQYFFESIRHGERRDCGELYDVRKTEEDAGGALALMMTMSGLMQIPFALLIPGAKVF
jgi:hypothetical protein